MMIQHLIQEKLWPIPKANDTCLSVQELSKISHKIQEDIDVQVVKQCWCATDRRGSSRCNIELPLVFGESCRVELQQMTRSKFDSHFLTRGVEKVSES